MTTAIGFWVDLPTSGGARDRLGADEPGGAGLFQIATSNATLATRENELRVLFEDLGESSIFGDLLIAGDPSTFPWRREDSDGVWVRFAGLYRVRLYGETSRPPRIRFSCRALAPGGFETGIILALSRGVSFPEGGPNVSTTTSSTSLVDLSVTMQLTPDDLTTEPLSLQSEGNAVAESGAYTTVGVWIGAWCTSGSDAAKAELYGASVLLMEPA